MFKNKGFTLLEILIAVFILAVVMTTVYAAFRGTFSIIQGAEEDGEIYSMARSAMQRMLKDFASVAARGGKFTFVTRASKVTGANFMDITFVSNAHLAFYDDEPTAGLAEITYYIEEDPSEGYRLMRSDTVAAESDRGDKQYEGFVLAKKIQSLTYTLYDAAGKEYTSWDSIASNDVQKNKVPVTVVVALTLTNSRNKERPYVFATRVFMPLSIAGSVR